MTAVLLSLTTFLSTLAGGLFALKFRDRLHYILAFTAGVLLGVVAFDILPEVFELAHARGSDATAAMVALVLGFLLFHGLEKFVLIHHGHEGTYASHHHPQVGVLSALALAGHSFMDGVGIGLAADGEDGRADVPPDVLLDLRDRAVVGAVGEQSSCPLLQVDSRRPETAGRRSRGMAAHRFCDR